MRAVAVVALVLCLLAVAVKAEEPLTSLMELDSAMPGDLSSTVSDAKIQALHEAAGSFADEAIADAKRDSLLMETEATSTVGRHWDDSVPEIHLHSTQPEETLSTSLETVDHLDHVRPGLTAEAPSAVLSAFQQKISPAILGEDHVFIQHAAKATQTAAAEAEVQAVVVSDANSEADSVTEAEAAQGVMTMSELEQMMELEGMSQQEIDQYMENLGQMTVDVEAESATESEADVEAEVEAEAAAAADSEAVQAVVVDVSAETDAEGEVVQTVQVDAESDAGVEAEAETEAETETEAAAETETETETETEADAESESESEGEYKLSAEELAEIKAEAEAEVAQESPEQTVALLEADSESEAEAETETEGSFDMELDAEAESDAESEAEAETETETESQDEVVHLAEHAVPAQLQESTPSTVTPLHSAAYTRAHPTLKRLASAPVASGYSLPQPMAMMETASKAREVDLEKYNPNAIQLGPSKDAYGYVPMTGAEFLNSRNRPVSLAQMSVQMQHQEGTWLPPPIEAEATPNYIVGVGGLRPNPNAGPYQGQYGLAAGGQSVHQEPSFIQY